MSRSKNLRTAGTIKNFDVDFAPCNCKGTTHLSNGLQVISVKWKRTDKNPRGRVRFICQRCKKSWSMDNVHFAGTGLQLDANHPEERARRRAIHPDYDYAVAVNLHQGRQERDYSAIAKRSKAVFPEVYPS